MKVQRILCSDIYHLYKQGLLTLVDVMHPIDDLEAECALNPALYLLKTYLTELERGA